MTRPPLEVADIIRAHGDAFLRAYGGALSSAKMRVLRDLASCRTAALGGHLERCDACGHERPAFNSCRNRHCPKCQATARAKWLDAQEAMLLPVPYFHVVFTVPDQIAQIALQNKRVMYDILMRAAADTLLEIAADPKHLGAKIGFLSVLHTWGQNLMHHPHVHCVAPGGGLSLDGQRWIPSRPTYFLPVQVLARLFRGKFLAMTKRAFTRGELPFHGELADSTAFAAHLEPCYDLDWVVYSKPPFGGPIQVLKYLAGYTHRVAISNHRLVALDEGRVRFRYKDYRRGNKKRVMTLEAVEFIRRFLLHVLPRGFMRIRHNGLLANTCRSEMIDRCRALLTPHGHAESERETASVLLDQEDQPQRCPKCNAGRMRIVQQLPPAPLDSNLFLPAPFDTS